MTLAAICLSVLVYLACGIAWCRARWRKFLREEASYWEKQHQHFMRGDEMNDFRYQMWTDVVAADQRLNKYPPNAANYSHWLVANVLLWPLVLIGKALFAWNLG